MSARPEFEATSGESDELLREMKSLPTTSARIRALHARGMKKADIVRYLNAHFREPSRPHDYRYQHVHNVLSQSLATRNDDTAIGEEKDRPAELPERLDVHLDSVGRIVIPAAFRAAMQVKEGDRLLARVVEGELRLITPQAAIKRAQRLVRERISGDESLIDVLMEHRRREVADEFGNG